MRKKDRPYIFELKYDFDYDEQSFTAATWVRCQAESFRDALGKVHDYAKENFGLQKDENDIDRWQISVTPYDENIKIEDI